MRINNILAEKIIPTYFKSLKLFRAHLLTHILKIITGREMVYVGDKRGGNNLC